MEPNRNLLLRLFWLIVVLFFVQNLQADWPDAQRHYWRVVMPIMRTHCNQACHNADDKKGGLNLNRYDFIKTIQRDGEVFFRVIEHVKAGTMPPAEYPPLTTQEKDTLTYYLEKYINEALNKPDPGLIPPRRLSNREYQYAIEDLTGITINTDSIFPRDPAGGEGFDNFARSLYITPLLMERYFEVAENVIESWAADQQQWHQIHPLPQFSLGQRISIWWQKWWHHKDLKWTLTKEHAINTLTPFATKAYRRYLSAAEKGDLMQLFESVYRAAPDSLPPYETAIKEVFKMVLVSHHFLMRQEADPIKPHPYPIDQFELASRLSFFLWSSIPDFELLEIAYRADLHNRQTLQKQILRMLNDPKAWRMAESFATQWLDIDQLKDPTHEVDTSLFPKFNPSLREDMHHEPVAYFYHTLTESRNLLELLDGNYSFINESLANHYGVQGIIGPEMRKVTMTDPNRGGILGMGGVLTVSSLPNRTSPVLRGKWVMEKILATPAKPPPPNVPELESSKNIHDELTLRQLLVRHRDDPGCIGCHQEMDDLGFALENFDAIGQYRKRYQPNGPIIDVSGTLKSGEHFEGPHPVKESTTH